MHLRFTWAGIHATRQSRLCGSGNTAIAWETPPTHGTHGRIGSEPPRPWATRSASSGPDGRSWQCASLNPRPATASHQNSAPLSDPEPAGAVP